MKKLLALLFAFVFAFGVFSGCKPDDGPGTSIGDDDPTQKVTFNVWMPLEPWSIPSFSNRDFGENEIIKEIEKKFNVDFVFTHPVTGSEIDQFSLMISDKNLPDLIFAPSWYAGGIEQGIRDGAYLDITSYVPEYMPNYNKILNENLDIKSMAITDSGKIGSIYGVSLYEEYPYYGPLLKSKWLQDVGEDVPVTIADWERVLTKFKEQKNASAPFILDPTGWDYTAGTFLTAFGIGPAWYLDGSEIKYGPMEQGFYDYLNLMRDWIKKGLIDPNFNENDWNDILNQIISVESGAMTQSPDTMSVYFENAGIDWCAAPYPVLNEGDEIKYRQKSWKLSDGWMTAAAISTSCKNVERLMKCLDYGYSEEGSTLFNFGIKDRAYTEDENGNKTFTDLIYNNKYGLTPTQTVWRYKVHAGLFIRDEHNANPIFVANKQSQDARKMWSETSTDAVIPPLSYTREENQTVSANMAAINSYLGTQALAFLTGVENDLSGTADVITDPTVFRNTLKTKGFQETLDIIKAAYQRYLNR